MKTGFRLVLAFVLTLPLVLRAEETETLRVSHVRYYASDRNIPLSQLLGLADHEGQWIESVSIVYDSRLEGKRLAWLLDAVMLEMDPLPAGRDQEVSVVLNRPIEPGLLLEAQAIARMEAIKVKEVRATLRKTAAEPAAGPARPGSPRSPASPGSSSSSRSPASPRTPPSPEG